MTIDASFKEELIKDLDSRILQMLLRQPEYNFDIVIVDSIEAGLETIKSLVDNETLIGVSSAIIRHKIAFYLGLDINRFKFVRGNFAEEEFKDKSLLLWDYLQMQQPLAGNLLSRPWDSVILLILLNRLETDTYSISDLLIPESP